MAEEATGKTKAKRTSNRATGPKPVYVLYKPEVGDDGKIVDLEITRSPARAMKFLSDNPGAKVEEKTLAA